MYIVCQCMNHICTMYVQCMYMVQTVVSTGFRGRQRDADAGQRDIPLPSASRDDMDGGSPCPEDGDFFDARPDAEDTEGAINKFLEGLESQEEAGFDRLHSLLSKLRPSFPFLLPPMAAICRMLRLWRVAFCPKWMRNSRNGLHLLSSYCTGMQ